MGANVCTGTMSGDLEERAVSAAFEQWRRGAERESGQSYSGSWNMVWGIEFFAGVQPSEQEACDYLDARMRKNESAGAVRFVDVEYSLTKQPTFAGKPSSYVAGPGREDVYATNYAAGVRSLVPADQLTAAQNRRLLKQVTNAETYNAQSAQSKRDLDKLVQALYDAAESVNAGALRSTRKRYFAAAKKAEAAKSVLDANLVALRSSLYKYKQSKSEKWLIYAICGL